MRPKYLQLSMLKALSELAPPFASDDKLNFDLIVLARNELMKPPGHSKGSKVNLSLLAYGGANSDPIRSDVPLYMQILPFHLSEILGDDF